MSQFASDKHRRNVRMCSNVTEMFREIALRPEEMRGAVYPTTTRLVYSQLLLQYLMYWKHDDAAY